MRKLIYILASVLITATMWAQSPQKMSYQAIIRDANNKLITSQSVGMRISILQGSASGMAVYTETQTPTTNANGLVSIEIGGGAGFDAINWGNGTYFIKTETDPTGGTNYTITGTSQLLSVPYALHAMSSNVTFSVSATGDTLNLGNGQHIFISGISAANPISNDYILNVTATNGTVLKNPNLATYNSGATVQLTATPNSGYAFTSWSGGATSSTNPLPVFMNSNKNITANFTAVAANTFTINTIATNGTILKYPDLISYKNGAVVRLTATPNPGYRFISWSGDATGSKNPLPVYMNANKNITANFIEGDTKALQALIDSCPTNGTVSIPAGTYYIDAVISLELKSNMTLKMDSDAILKAIPNNMDGYRIIFMNGVSNVKIIGGTLQGERAQHIGTTGEFGMGVSINASHNILVQDVITKDNWGDGIFVGYGCTDITIDGVTADNNRRQGLSITWVDGIIVRNCIFSNTNGTPPADGIDIETDDAASAVNNVLIQNCSFINNEEGIRSTDGNGVPTNVIIENNTCTNNRYGGIDITPSGIGEIVRGNICNGNRIGILLGNNGPWATTGNSVTGNTVNNNATYGILINNGATGNTITGNTVLGNPSGNISDEVGGNTISGNTIN